MPFYILMILLVMLAYAFHYYVGQRAPDWGPRYFYELLLPVILLLAPLLAFAWDKARTLPRRQQWALGLLLAGFSFLHTVGVCRQHARGQ